MSKAEGNSGDLKYFTAIYKGNVKFPVTKTAWGGGDEEFKVRRKCWKKAHDIPLWDSKFTTSLRDSNVGRIGISRPQGRTHFRTMMANGGHSVFRERKVSAVNSWRHFSATRRRIKIESAVNWRSDVFRKPVPLCYSGGSVSKNKNKLSLAVYFPTKKAGIWRLFCWY